MDLSTLMIFVNYEAVTSLDVPIDSVPFFASYSHVAWNSRSTFLRFVTHME